MKYCLKCNHLHNDTDSSCSYCKCSLADINDENTSVFLVSSSESEVDKIKKALEENGISCESVKNPNFNPDAPQDEDNGNLSILIPYSAYEKAYSVCVKIGVIEDEALKIEEEYEEMSSAKRTTVRIVSAIFFILVAALAIYGTDAIMAIIKNLFK
ncbi:MAG: hypothetical protein UH080_07980 [Ruminococcus sp.]|nr:hypothetical protein [Ruminococcus sp.]